MSTRALSLAALLLVAGCSGAASNDSSSGYVDDAGVGSDDSAAAVTGLPCDVADVLAAKCVSCHSNPPTGGAPIAIASYEDLVAKSSVDSTKTVAQRSLERMQDTASPMPPGGGATADDIAKIKAWIDGGMTKGDCASTVDAGPSPWDAPVGCVSGTKWTRGDRGSSSMHPGKACISCHLSSGVSPFEAPTFLGGTVYSSAHEVDDCNAVSSAVSGATVVITGADGKVLNLPVNSVGNFYTASKVATPYSAKVVKGGKERVMAAKQTSGDCNSCHTQDGAGDPKAPGRIILP